MPHLSYTRLILIAGLVLSVFFVELGSARLWDRDEPRNARASHEMLARGDWIVPTFNGSLRDHKPILLYWGQMLSYLAFGESEFSARLPSALGALLSVLAVAVLASRLAGKPRGISQEGFWAAGALATCLLFVMAGRAATPDSCLIAFSTLGIAALVLSALAPALPYSSGHVGAARWLPAMVGYAMLGLAGLAKGPVGILLPLVVVHSWWLICQRLQNRRVVVDEATSLSRSAVDEATSPSQRSHPVKNQATRRQQWLGGLSEVWLTFNPWQCLRAVWFLKAIPGVLLSLLVAAPWYIAVGLQTDGAFLRGFFLDHNLGRAMGSMEGHEGSIFFYPVAFVIGTFPWSLWLIPIVMWCRQAARESVVHRQMVVLAGVWVAVYVTAFSLASTKLPSYITPCYAGAALAIGGYWRQFESAWARPSKRIRRIAYCLTILVGCGISGGLWWLSEYEQMPLLSRTAVVGLIVAAMGGLGLWWERRTRAQWVPLTWLTGAAAFQIILFGFGARSIDAYRQDLALLKQFESGQVATPWLSIGGMEPSWVHYLGQPIVEVTTAVSDPAAWTQVERFLSEYPHGRLLVVGEEAQAELQKRQTAYAAFRLHELAHADRFLRPGKLGVYEQIAPPITGQIAERQPAPILPQAEPAMGENSMRAPAARTAQADDYPNPLRTPPVQR